MYSCPLRRSGRVARRCRAGARSDRTMQTGHAPLHPRARPPGGTAVDGRSTTASTLGRYLPNSVAPDPYSVASARPVRTSFPGEFMAFPTRRRVVTTALATLAAGAAVPFSRPRPPRPSPRATARPYARCDRPTRTTTTSTRTHSTTLSLTGSPASRRTSSSWTGSCSSPTKPPTWTPPAPLRRSTLTRCWPGSGPTTARCTPGTANPCSCSSTSRRTAPPPTWSSTGNYGGTAGC